jgi:elongation factor G
MEQTVRSQRERIIESVAELDDELLEKYLEGEPIDEEKIITMLHGGILDAKIFPVFVGSVANMIGINLLSEAVTKYLPSPLERSVITGRNLSGEEIQREPSEKEPLSAYIFKTISDPYAGKISIFRVFSGSLNGDSSTFNSTKNIREKLGHIHRLVGKKEYPFSPAACGDIAAVNKLKDASTGDTLSDETDKIIIPPVELPQTVLSYAIEPKSRGQAQSVPRKNTGRGSDNPIPAGRRDEGVPPFGYRAVTR